MQRGFVVRHGPAEVQFTIAGTPDQVTPRVMSAFMAETLSVTSSQPGVIEARLPADKEIGVTYQVVARALITASDSGRTLVRLYGERSVSAVSSDPIDTQRIDGGMFGRAGATWLSLLKIAVALQPDSSRRTVVLPE
jgi:hypothetical protein